MRDRNPATPAESRHPEDLMWDTTWGPTEDDSGGITLSAGDPTVISAGDPTVTQRRRRKKEA